MASKNVLSENIRLFRKSLNLKQDDLGRLVGVTQANVSQWENGASTPPISVIEIIKKRYPKVSAETFFTAPVPNKDFQVDPRDVELKKARAEMAELRTELDAREAKTKEHANEIKRLRDQIDVLTMFAKNKLSK